jgi:hypothetical protein
MKMWLDDIRKPPDDSWAWVTTAQAALEMLKSGEVTEASLDHDLEFTRAGCADPFGRGTGLEVAQFIAEMEKPPVTRVHSMNPVGAKAMREVLAEKERR